MRPKNAVFRTVNGIEEAFRPGTERQIREEAPRPIQPVGPQNYNDVIRREQEAAQAPAAAAEPRLLTHFEAARELKDLGVAMNEERVSQLRAWHPEGVPEDQLATLQHRLTVRAGLRVVGGVAANE